MSLRDLISDLCGGEALFLDDHRLDSCLIGYAERAGMTAVAAYDLEAVAQILVQDGMSSEEAKDYIEFNIIGAWMGDSTPVFVTRVAQ